MRLLPVLLVSAAARDDSISLLQLQATKRHQEVLPHHHIPKRLRTLVIQAMNSIKPPEFVDLPPPDDAPRDVREAAAAAPETHDLKFTELTINNLNGVGPDTGLDPVLRFASCATKDARAVDCVVSSSEGYEAADPGQNGLFGKLGNINIKNDNRAAFTVKFLDSETDQPVELGEFFFSIFDIDTGKGWGTNGTVKPAENLQIFGYKHMFKLPVDKEGTIVKDNEAWKGTDHGTVLDNPKDPIQLTTQQVQRAVSFIFPSGKTGFDFAYKNDKAGPSHYSGGRNVLFAGMSSLNMCKTNKVNLDLDLSVVTRNNLGGIGPDSGEEGIYYEKIATLRGTTVDLEVNAIGDYKAYNSSRNGKLGYFGQINLQIGTDVDLKFSLRNHMTGEPYEAAWMYFSLFDFDHAQHRGKPVWQEYMTASGMSQIMLTDDTNVAVKKEGSKYVMASTLKGTGKDNPDDPLRLTTSQRSKSVALTYHNVSSWTMNFRVGGPATKPGRRGRLDGRNFLFSGKSSTDPCEMETYKDVVNVAADHIHDASAVGPHFSDAGDDAVTVDELGGELNNMEEDTMEVELSEEDQHFQNVFGELFDTDANGFCTETELKKVMIMFDPQVTDQDVKNDMMNMDSITIDGQMDLDEFKVFLNMIGYKKGDLGVE